MDYRTTFRGPYVVPFTEFTVRPARFRRQRTVSMADSDLPGSSLTDSRGGIDRAICISASVHRLSGGRFRGGRGLRGG